MNLKIITEAWATIQSRTGKPSAAKKYEDPNLFVTLDKVSKKWDHDQPASEFSILTSKGEVVYIGLYPEGVVLRLKDESSKAVFLTREMAKILGEKLVGLVG